MTAHSDRNMLVRDPDSAINSFALLWTNIRFPLACPISFRLHCYAPLSTLRGKVAVYHTEMN